MRTICALLLRLLAAAMIIGIVLAVVGFLLAFVAAVLAAIAIAATSTPITLAGLLAVSGVGQFIIVGLALMTFGILLFLGALALSVLVDFLCRAVGPGFSFGRLPDPKDIPRYAEELRCLIAPLFPAAMMLLLAIPVALLLYFLLRGAGYDLGSPGVGTLIIAVVVLLCVFGLLLALVPFVWCCCKCRKRGDAASLLDPVLDALESTAVAVETAGGAIGNVKTAFDNAGDKLQKAGDKIGGFSISVPVPPSTDPLSHFGIAVPGHVKILTGDFGSQNEVPTGAEVAQTLLNTSGQALKDNGALLSDVKSKHDAAARGLRAVAAVLRSLTA